MPTFTAPLWEHAGDTSWHFVSLPAELSDQVRELSGPRRGFGSVRVEVTVGDSTWRTSVFPSRHGTYDLPVKAAVRRSEGLEPGDPVTVLMEVSASGRQ